MKSEQRCANCMHWDRRTPHIFPSVGLGICTGLKEEWKLLKGAADGTMALTADSAVVEEAGVYDDPVRTRFLTGPDFGCIHFKRWSDL
jgi:hypothetical protein